VRERHTGENRYPDGTLNWTPICIGVTAELLFPALINHPVFHHKAHIVKGGDVCGGIARYRDDIGQQVGPLCFSGIILKRFMSLIARLIQCFA